MRYKLLLILVAIILLLTGCTIGDPLVDDFYTSASFIRVNADGSGGYWNEFKVDVIALSPGGSGATQITPNVSTLGGFQLNSITEYLYFDTHIDADWDGISDGAVIIYFEVNDDNSGGLVTDTVKIGLEDFHKSLGGRTNDVSSHEGNTVVGQAQQHDLFVQSIVIDDLHMFELITFRLNLNTIGSQVDDIIINYIEFRYPTYLPAVER